MGAGAAGIVISLIGTAVSIKASRDAAEQQEEIRGSQAAVAAQRRIEERRAAFRRRRLAIAKVNQAAASEGTAGSSTQSGAVGSLITQGGAERAGFGVREDAEQRISRAQSKISSANQLNQIGQSVSSIGGSIFQMGGRSEKKPEDPAFPE